MPRKLKKSKRQKNKTVKILPLIGGICFLEVKLKQFAFVACLILLPALAAAQSTNPYSAPSTFNPYDANRISPSAGLYGVPSSNPNNSFYNQNSVANPYDRQTSQSPTSQGDLYGLYGNRYNPQLPNNVYETEIKEKTE